MTKLKVLDLFSGIGGFSLGLERTGGFETVAFCEIEKFPSKVLAKHWPEVPIYHDIATADFHSLGPVDVVTAGFPCQDISLAGKGAGLAGGRSGLFWHIIRTVRMVGRPKLLLENVAALLDRGLGSVLGALASVGYDAEWHCIPASAVGAPHFRDRIWILADPDEKRSSPVRGECQDLQEEGSIRRDDIGGGKVASERKEPIRGAREVGACPDADQNSRERKQPICADAEGWPRPLSGHIGPLLDGHGGWEAEPAISRVADGIPNQSHRIASCGNAVVPQIPELIGRAILEAAE